MRLNRSSSLSGGINSLARTWLPTVMVMASYKRHLIIEAGVFSHRRRRRRKRGRHHLEVGSLGLGWLLSGHRPIFLLYNFVLLFIFGARSKSMALADLDLAA